MSELSKLNRPFEPDQILTSDELNTITDRIDEIIGLILSLDPLAPSPTDLDLQNKFDNAKKELLELLNKALKDLWEKMEIIDELPEGITQLKGDFNLETFIKKTENAVNWVTLFSLTYKEIDLGVYEKKLSEINEAYEKIGSLIKINADSIKLITGNFDEDGNLKINNPAAIVLALTEEKSDGKRYLKSTIGISADQITLDSNDVNILGALNVQAGIKALRGYISDLSATNLNVKNQLETLDATVKGKANIADLTALNATINGKANVNDLDTLTLVVQSKASINELNTLSAHVDNLLSEILTAVNATINNLHIPNAADIKRAVIEDLTVVKSVKTGTTGYIAEVNAANDVGYFRIYNAQNGKDTVRILGWDLSNGSGSVGSAMYFQSLDYSVANKTGWMISFGAGGIYMQTFRDGEESTISLAPDSRPGTSGHIVGMLDMRTFDSSGNPIYRRLTSGDSTNDINSRYV